MLFVLQIKNFALIDYLELTFSPGLNVLTGETGAGKSIILDAIDIVLGGKVNSRQIRQGSQQAMLEATFKVDFITIKWLESQEIEPLEENQVICSRELTLNGDSLRSRSRVNGVLVNRQLMSQLRDRLVEMTAQGQTVQLMDATNQRELLDLYGTDLLLQQRQVVASAYETWKEAKKALEGRRQSEQNRLQRLDLLEYQLKELEAVNLAQPNELDQLEQERDRLSHVVDLQHSSYQVYQLLYQNDNGSSAVTDLLGQAESFLTNMTNYDKDIEPVLEMVKEALNQVVEVGHQINAYGDNLETDPERLTEVEERIVLLKRICRKYGSSLADVIQHYQKLQQELAELTDQGQSLAELEQIYQATEEKFNQTCEKLTYLRQQAASKLEKQLVQELKPLAMEKVIFVCQITPMNANQTGADQVIFYFSPNPGEKIQPLSSTASGGEMSRFLLALKACFSQADETSKTLIFDEIDAGISGKVAQAIAEKLHQLSQRHQVLCVTHQPLVAAMADTHWRVDKQIIEGLSLLTVDNNHSESLSEIRTVIRVTLLESHQTRREEIAQLTGGHSSKDALAFADSVLIKAAAHRFRD